MLSPEKPQLFPDHVSARILFESMRQKYEEDEVICYCEDCVRLHNELAGRLYRQALRDECPERAGRLYEKIFAKPEKPEPEVEPVNRGELIRQQFPNWDK